MDLSIVIVSWNVRELLEACLRSIHASLEQGRISGKGELGCEIIVVDSASRDGSPQMVRQRFPNVRLFAQEENIGFVRGSNLGIRESRGRYVLLLNPDTEIVGQALAEMVTYMDAHPDVGIVGPRLLYPDGRVQPSRRRFPTLATAFWESTVLQPWFPHGHVLDRYYVRDRSDDEEQDVDWVIGACFLVRRAAFERAGLLDEGFFMYSEEMDWAYRIKQAGWRVIYLPTATVIHHEGQSSSQVTAARDIHFHSSKVYFYRKYYGPFWGEVLRWFLLLTFAYQWLREGAKWLVGHKRPLRAERMRAYRQVLRSRLMQGQSFWRRSSVWRGRQR